MEGFKARIVLQAIDTLNRFPITHFRISKGLIETVEGPEKQPNL